MRSFRYIDLEEKEKEKNERNLYLERKQQLCSTSEYLLDALDHRFQQEQ